AHRRRQQRRDRRAGEAIGSRRAAAARLPAAATPRLRGGTANGPGPGTKAALLSRALRAAFHSHALAEAARADRPGGPGGRLPRRPAAALALPRPRAGLALPAA